MAAVSLGADSQKRPRPTYVDSTDTLCLHHSDKCLFSSLKKQKSSLLHYRPPSEVCACVSSPPVCNTEYADTADSSTGSSCCSSLPSYASSFTEQQMLQCMSVEGEAESCCGGNTASSYMDITCFLHDDGGDEAIDESFSFDAETIFFNDAGLTDFNFEEAVPFVGSSVQNGSWFLNDLDNHGEAFLHEVLDQEWMSAAVSNLEKLTDALSADSCVLHLLESDYTSKDHH